MTDTKTIALADGRTIVYAIYGASTSSAADGTGIPTVFYLHGFPGSHHEAVIFSEAAQQHGLRIVAPSRPGMGGSSFQANRTLLSYADDITSLADHLRISRFALLGVSGGAPYVLACWKRIPRARLVGAGIMSGLYPPALGLSGMLFGSRMLLWVAPWLTGLIAYGLDSQLGAAARDDDRPERFEAMLAESFKSRPAVDQAAWNADLGGLRGAMTKSTREAVRAGGQGPAWEARLFGSDWGFGLDDLEVEKGTLVMWHGSADVNVPVAMAVKAAALMPTADLHIEEGEGHCSIVAKNSGEAMACLRGML